MSMFSQFETSPKLETEGIYVDYGDYRVRLAHTGGANKKYLSMLEAEIKPYRRLIQNGTMDEKKATAIYYKVFAHTIVLGWDVKVGEDEENNPIWEPGIPKKGGGTLEVTPANIILTFNLLPNLFADLKNTADDIALYRTEGLEEDSGN